jgi:DNA-binding NarL/FixJ family response regulator
LDDAGVCSRYSLAAVKVLVADDHAIFRRGIRVVLDDLDPAVEVLEAGNFTEALNIAKDAADLALVLVDLRMPEMDSFDGLRALRRVLPRVPVMVLSASEEADDVFTSLECGASGYLPKSAPGSVMLEALRLILVGGIYVPRQLAASGKPLYQKTAPADRNPTLTPRQHAILGLVAAGHSNKEIAHRIGTTEGTVKVHVTAIMRALGVRNRIQLLLAAERRGIRPRSSD